MDKWKHKKNGQEKGKTKIRKKEIEGKMKIEDIRKVDLMKNYKGFIRRTAYS